MSGFEGIKEKIEKHKDELEAKFKVKKIALFGSYVSGNSTDNSDVDILVDFKEPVGFLFVHLAEYLEELLGRKVDLLTPNAIKPNRREYIFRNLIYV